MSALGHKRTFAVQFSMSALPPKADMCSATGDVRFVPIADIARPYRDVRFAAARASDHYMRNPPACTPKRCGATANGHQASQGTEAP